MGDFECKIETDEANYPYDNHTFGLISRLAHYIKSYSAKHGVPPIAVAGSIADEYNVQRGLRRLLDWFQDKVVLTNLPSAAIDLDEKAGFKSKFLNATRNDLGPGNINLATAREIYKRYKNDFPPEAADWSELVDFILSDRGTALIATLVIRKGKQELAQWLSNRPIEIQEALLVTYYKQGPSYIARYKARLRSQAFSTATLVPGEGCRVFHQREKFKTALGL